MASTGQIPRIELPSGWQVHRTRSSTLKSGPNQRPLRIAIDRGSVGSDEIADVLVEFGKHEAVEILSTEATDGTALLQVGPYQLGQIVSVSVTSPNRREETFVQPLAFWEEIARDAPGSEPDNIDALLIGHAASQVHVDALVTAHRFLLDSESVARRFIGDANPMTPREAVALLGLYLRLRDDFKFSTIVGTDRETYFDILTGALLPAVWRWYGACLASMLAGNSDSPVRLAQSALLRVNRALNARERLHEQYLTSASEGALQEAHAQLDTILQQLSGAFDVVARVAHRIYGLRGSPNVADWAWKWRTNKLARADGQLAALMDQGRSARDTFDVIAMLRNTIHGEALHRASHRTHRGASIDGFVAPAEKMTDLVSIARRRGGLDRWGIEPTPFPQQPFIIVADRFVEALVPDAIRALNRLMRQTDVALLPGVDPKMLRQRPPNSRQDIFANSWTRRRFRLLAGL